MPIRRAHRGDAEALLSLHVRAWQAAYGGYVDARRMDAVAEGMRAGYAGALVADDPETWVCADLSAFVTLGRSRDADVEAGEGELHAIYVEPSRVGTGVGAALHVHALDRLAALGFERASLWTFAQNAPALAFYAHHGWRRDPRPFDPDRWGWAPSVRLVRVVFWPPDIHAPTHPHPLEAA